MIPAALPALFARMTMPQITEMSATIKNRRIDSVRYDTGIDWQAFSMLLTTGESPMI
jgi:hypothetical protein